MQQWPYFVEERLVGGGKDKRALCHVCPLNTQRKVGHDGPADADHIVIAEAPGEDEEGWGRKYGHKYGRPLVGKSGFMFKVRYLAEAGLIDVVPGKRPGSITTANLRAHLMNVILCKPPKNKIDSKEGKAAVACCANSARWFLNERLAENRDRMLNPQGGTALSLVRGVDTPIEPYRGRPTGPFPTLALEYEPEAAIYKRVLRGRKPWEVDKSITEVEWQAIEWFLKIAITGSRASLRKSLKALAYPMEAQAVVWFVKKVIEIQRRRLVKCASQPSTPTQLALIAPASPPTPSGNGS